MGGADVQPDAAALYLCLLLLVVVLMNAVFRARCCAAREGGFAFMRLGMDEFRMLGLVVLMVCIEKFFAAVLIGSAAAAADHGHRLPRWARGDQR